MNFNRCILIYVLLLIPILADTDKTNPWEPYMEIYNIPQNHESGGLIDEEGILLSLITAENYTYPIGRCPVFGKILEKKIDERKIINTPILNQQKFLNDLSTGKLDHLLQNNKRLWFQFPTIKDEHNEYYKWVSPVKKKSIFGCSQYVNQFEHVIEKSDYNMNCVTRYNTGKCLKQPFLYDLSNKNCYILYPVKQRYFNESKPDLSYAPIKYFNQYVYGSSRIYKNWSQHCPVKTIKGAVFGKWRNDKCEMITPAENVTSKYNRTTCVNSFVDKVNEKPLYHWAIYSNNSCFLINLTPDCFLYDPDGYSTTSISMPTTTIYDLPPCIAASESWIIYANCKDGYRRKYICTAGKWVGNDGLTITKCTSRVSWTNVENLIADKEDEEVRQEKQTVKEDEEKEEEIEEIPEYLIRSDGESDISEISQTPAPKSISPKKRFAYAIIPDDIIPNDTSSSEEDDSHLERVKVSSSEKPTPSPSEESLPSPSKESLPSPSKESVPSPSKEIQPSLSKESLPSPSKEIQSSPSEGSLLFPSKESQPSSSKEPDTSHSKSIPSVTRNATLSKHNDYYLSTVKTSSPFSSSKFLDNFSSKFSSTEIVFRGAAFLLTASLFF